MSIRWVDMRSRGRRRRSHLFMEGPGGHVALFVSAFGALIGWLRASRKGSATLNVLLVVAIAAICVVGWRLVASSSDSLSAAEPGDSQSPQASLATPRRESALRTPVPASSPAALPTAESNEAAHVAASTPEKAVLDEEAWRQSFANASVHEILAASEALNSEVQEKAGPILDSMHAAGQSEFVGPETKYEGRTSDHEVVFRVYMEQGKGTYRVELPRADYPEIYALKARALWLEDLARKKQQG